MYKRQLRERRFTHTSDGAVSLVEWEQSPAGTSTGAGRRGPTVGNARVKVHTPCDQAEQERLWLWVRVDGDVLRGSEASVPVALAEGLGLAPLTRRTFSSRWGPVTLSYDTLQATRGPVRAVALATGAKVDDTLLLLSLIHILPSAVKASLMAFTTTIQTTKMWPCASASLGQLSSCNASRPRAANRVRVADQCCWSSS